MRFYISAPFFKTHFILSAFSITTLLLLTACGGGGGGGGGGVAGVVGLSQHGSTNSHTDSRRGSNCFDCHTNNPGNGTGTGVFITAGTTGATNGFVEYYADSGRTVLRARLEVDGNRNFYTVTPIDILTPNGSGFSQGAYVTIVTSGGARRNMSGSISHTTAGCNQCHGTTQSAL
jgi:hypothetical protein